MYKFFYGLRSRLYKFFRMVRDFFTLSRLEEIKDSIGYQNRIRYQDRIQSRKKGKKRRFMGRVGYGASIMDKKALKAYLAGSGGFRYKGKHYRSAEKWI